MQNFTKWASCNAAQAAVELHSRNGGTRMAACLPAGSPQVSPRGQDAFANLVLFVQRQRKKRLGDAGVWQMIVQR